MRSISARRTEFAKVLSAEYIGGMRVKTSVSLSKETLKAIDRLAGKSRSRSAVIEWALREVIEREKRRLRDEREITRINKHADRLNREALDALKDQVDLFEERT